MPSGTRSTVGIALAANLVIAVAKVAAGAITGSAAMLAEAAHSVADTLNQLILLASLRLGRRPPDSEHQFGHGKERFLWAFVAAVTIFVSGAGFSVAEGIYVIHTGGAGDVSFTVGYAVLAVALAAESTSLMRAIRQLRGGAEGSGLGFLRFVRESRDPTPKVVLLEDAAAVTGILLAFAGMGLRQATGSVAWDGAASIAIGALLAAVAVAIGTDSRGLLLGEAARPDIRAALERAAESHRDIESVTDLRTMHVGPHELLVAARVEMRDELRIPEAERLAQAITDRLREVEPAVKHVFLHPTPGRGHDRLRQHVDGAADQRHVEDAADRR